MSTLFLVIFGFVCVKRLYSLSYYKTVKETQRTKLRGISASFLYFRYRQPGRKKPFCFYHYSEHRLKSLKNHFRFLARGNRE